MNREQVRAAVSAIEESIPRDAVVGIYLYGAPSQVASAQIATSTSPWSPHAG